MANASRLSGVDFALPMSCGRASVIFSTGRGTPMIPVEEGKICFRPDFVQRLCRPLTYQLGRLDTRLSCRAIGIACIHDQRMHPPVGFSQMIATHSDRRSHNLVAREHGRGRGALWNNGACQIGLAAGLQTGCASGKNKSLGNSCTHTCSLTSGKGICKSRAPICFGISPRYMAISSHACRLGQCRQSL